MGQEGQMSALILAPLTSPREAEALGQQVGTPRVCGGAPRLGLWEATVMHGRLSQRRASRFLIHPGAPVWSGCWAESQWLCQCVHHDREAVSERQELVQGRQ